MSVEGIPPGGFRTVGQIVGTNELSFHPERNAMAVASDLLSAHTTGAPVVNDHGVFIGFISEVDLLKALEAGKSRVTAAGHCLLTCPVAVMVTIAAWPSPNGEEDPGATVALSTPLHHLIAVREVGHRIRGFSSHAGIGAAYETEDRKAWSSNWFISGSPHTS